VSRVPSAGCEVRVKIDLLRQIFEDLSTPFLRITLRDIEGTLRKAMAHDPERAERAVGVLYGGVFKNREMIYEANGGRMP
jgi:hypothetical protein